MFIRNLNLRKRLGMSKLMEADAGAGAGGSSEADENLDNDDKTEESTEENKEEKTFTQEEVNKLLKDRIAREKKGQLSKEELKAYQEWKDSQKTEDEKKNEKLTQAEIKAKEAEERALLAETKVTCLSKGVNATSVDDVVVLAKAMVSDDVTIDQAIDKVLEKYPHFKGEAATEEQKGFKKIGAPGSKGSKANEEALKAAFGIK
ncbi:vancomycin resistance protein YoaR [Clostridium beijerinckii]|uniref:hypothetical protein n=1 Tax=Clostridium beijerinckii TaxID=1520 RepID=UPI0014947760|nr:hypothetical protein [Clostridium beijerinckii]NOW84285.1 vancomycin resistance protein YoaR [Clostridium beijerinckii]